MKTKLLYLASFLLVFFTSCSVDENGNEPTVDEKEEAVKELFDSFSKSVVDSPSYSKFIKTLQTKSSSSITAEELQKFEQEFLSQQTAEFAELYYYVSTLDITREELRSIVIAYAESVNRNFSGGTKDNSDGCAELDNQESDDYLIVFLSKLLCEVTRNN
ncbi:hypothetical protein [uncultured Aquimarina sp.]|uniref:hypothetical protein n=1 Tax=uncultured Aquimarina sp. TaxID=575652 RepID=UPI00260A735D|nr:hypothetical protein [uncultured Aquimarina sp.]